MFIVGLDKASNNVCIVRIYHPRVQVLHRLREKDFHPIATFVNDMVSMLQMQLLELIIEVQFCDVGLPYLMVTYNLHKMKYYWLTNTINCLFLGFAIIITFSMQLIIIELKIWCKLCSEMYCRFGRATANLFWVINLLFEFTLNLPEAIHGIYMADITWSYKSIPLSGLKNLPNALHFVISLAFQQHHDTHHKEQVIWVHINVGTRKVDSAK